MSKLRKTQSQFISESISVHGNKYNYNQSIYRGVNNRITIICHKHGPFEQLAMSHLIGKGCGKCAGIVAVREDFSDVVLLDGSMIVPLNDGHMAIVDKEDYERVIKHNWHLAIGKYAHKNNNIGSTSMHRYILGLTDRYKEADHLNGDGLDNRKSNLRICDRKSNSYNQPRRKNKKGRFKGVYNTTATRWQAKIIKDGKTYCLGSFGNEEDAAIAYDKKAIELFGEFARLNFIDMDKNMINPNLNNTLYKQ